MSIISRRAAIGLGGMFALAKALRIDEAVLVAQAPIVRVSPGVVPVQVTAETWILRAPQANGDLNHDLAHHPFRSLSESIRETHAIEHAYLRIGGLDFHGLPTDPVTGERREFSNLNGAILQVYALTRLQSDKERDNHHHEQGVSRQLTLSSDFSSVPESVVVAAIADMGAAINHARFPYQPISFSREVPPTNSNAVYAALASVIGVCPPANCHAEETNFLPHFVPGINAGLAIRVHPKGTYVSMARKVTSDTIARLFNQDRNSQFSGRSQSKLNEPAYGAQNSAYAGGLSL